MLSLFDSIAIDLAMFVVGLTMFVYDVMMMMIVVDLIVNVLMMMLVVFGLTLTIVMDLTMMLVVIDLMLFVSQFGVLGALMMMEECGDRGRRCAAEAEVDEAGRARVRRTPPTAARSSRRASPRVVEVARRRRVQPPRMLVALPLRPASSSSMSMEFAQRA